jgi:exopolysaccharide biosynthesis polyprenyl glycosylphosphotransferase
MSDHLVTTEGPHRYAPAPGSIHTQPLAYPPAPNIQVPWVLGRAAADAVMVAIATSIGELPGILSSWWQGAIMLLTLSAFAASGSYLPRTRIRVGDELRRIVAGSAVVLLLFTAASRLLGGPAGIGDAMVVHWLLISALVCTSRVGLAHAERISRARSGNGRRTLIVGAGHVGQLTAKRLLGDPGAGLVPIGYLDKEPLAGGNAELLGMPALPVLGASWDLEQVVRSEGVEHVVIAFSTAPHHVLLRIVRACWELRVDVSVVPRLYEVGGMRMDVDHLGALPLVGLRATDPRGTQFAVKYALDRVIAAAVIITIAPLIGAVALAVLVSMGRPILFRQKRVGRDGRVFEMYKFRTMRGGPSESGEADAGWASLVLAGGEPVSLPEILPMEDRRTPVGSLLRKLSLDELAQLWNVVRGDMSLIGPRPERAHYVQAFDEAIYRYPDRHRVKSGLTGWAQVHGLRGETSLADRVEWDNFYIENWSPWLDLKIVLMTVPALFGRRGGS